MEEHKRLMQTKIHELSGLIISRVHFCDNGDIEKKSSGKKRSKVIGERYEQGMITVY